MKFLNIKSFNISIFLHACMIVIVSFLMRSPEEQVSGRKIVFLNFDSISTIAGKRGAAGGDGVKKNQIFKFDSVQKEMISDTSTVSASSLNSGVGSGSGIETGGSGFEGSILNYSEPIYPRLALKRGIEGSLRIKIKINADGLPLETIVLKSSGSDLLDNAVIEAAKKWVFKKNESAGFYFVEKNIVFEIKK